MPIYSLMDGHKLKAHLKDHPIPGESISVRCTGGQASVTEEVDQMLGVIHDIQVKPLVDPYGFPL